MSQTIDNHYIKQYEAEVHTAYQRKGSKLRGTVRTVNNVKGSTVQFPKVGLGVAGTKSKHGTVPVMNADHSTVTATLVDYYAGDWADKLDLLKSNTPEKQIISDAGAFALGRKTDDLILTAMSGATNSIVVGTTGMSVAKLLAGISELGDRDVPIDDGMLFAAVGMQEWTELLQDEKFASADYVPESEMPLGGRGKQAKWFAGAYVFPTSQIQPDGSDHTTNYLYHKTAVGHAIGADVMADITWHGDRASWFINNMMSQAAVLIDNNGVQKIIADRSPA